MTDRFAFERIKASGLPVLLYGMGNGAEQIKKYLDIFDIPLKGVFASAGFVRGQSFMGFKVIDYERAEKRFGRFLVVPAFGTDRPDVMENIEKLSEKQTLVYPDLPLYGGQLMDREYVGSHKEDTDGIKKLIADKRSLSVLEEWLDFKISGDIAFLKGIMESPEEVMKKAAAGTRRFADLGAYDGDTVLSYARSVPCYDEIYAVEPDPYSFKRLLRNTSGLKGVKALNCAVSDTGGTLAFSSESSRNSHVSEEGICVRAEKGDDLLYPLSPDLIKMDLEGHEMRALKGMKRLIKDKKPDLLIAVYHRTDDFFEIPFFIKDLVPEYRLSFCKYSCYPSWDMFAHFTVKT